MSDAALNAYIADTRHRISAMTKATLRQAYAEQLRIAERVKAERSMAAP
jgi:hypothetical protein